MNVGEDDDHPWLGDVTALLRIAMAARTPALGICLGGQLVAAAADAPVAPAREPEAGWSEVELTRAGSADPVLVSCRNGSPRCSGTATRSRFPPLRSSWRARRPVRRPSGSRTPGASSSIPR